MTGGVSLTVNSGASPAMVGGVAPSAGDFFVLVAVTLKNTGAGIPLSTAAAVFSLETAQALVVTAAPEQPSSACNGMVSVASGGQIDCQIAFQVPSGQTAATLLYDDMRGDKASAPVPMIAIPSPDCTKYERWASSALSGPNCLGCITIALQSGGACASAIGAYSSACPNDGGPWICASGDLCTCEIAMESASCHMLFDSYVTCIVANCSSSCP
jgi:hypothetical protein